MLIVQMQAVLEKVRKASAKRIDSPAQLARVLDKGRQHVEKAVKRPDVWQWRFVSNTGYIEPGSSENPSRHVLFGINPYGHLVVWVDRTWRAQTSETLTIVPALLPRRGYELLTYDGRIFCDVCLGLVGQRSLHRDGRNAEVAIDVHFAPCGMRCAGSREDPPVRTSLHRGVSRCPRCAFVPCPVCGGTGRLEVKHGSIPDDVDEDDLVIGVDGDPKMSPVGMVIIGRRTDVNGQSVLTALQSIETKKCERCTGVGKVRSEPVESA